MSFFKSKKNLNLKFGIGYDKNLKNQLLEMSSEDDEFSQNAAS